MAEERVTRFDMSMIRSILTTMTNEIVKNNKEIQKTQQSIHAIFVQIKQVRDGILDDKKQRLESERLRLKTLASSGGSADDINRVVSNIEKYESKIEEMINEEKQEAQK